MTIYLLNSDARNIPLADQSVQCIITSPPYYGLRDYGISNQIGLERTPQEYVASIVAVMRECWRVLKDDGVLWLNIGDSYARNGGNPGGGNRESMHLEGKQKRMNHIPDQSGLKEKDLIGIPWRCAFALQDAGWYLRSDVIEKVELYCPCGCGYVLEEKIWRYSQDREIIWEKPNPMPESATDRPTKAHEYIFLLTKRARYYYDAEAIQESSNGQGGQAANFARATKEAEVPGQNNKSHRLERDATFDTGYRNRRSVWTVATMPYNGAHFATFPPKLIEPMVLAGSRPGDLILDPFAGTATVGRVAIKYQRRFVGLDLNLKYIGDLAHERTSKVQISMTL